MEVFNLDIIPGKAMPVIHCSQFDKGRAYRANLFERGAVYILNGAETLSIIEKKSDGNMVTISVTNTSDSFIEFEITEQMSAIAGPQLCELRIEEGGNVIGSLNFALDCEASPDTGIESDSAIHNLEEQIAEAVADQYDADSVVFDAAPTAGHGVGFAVTSEGVKTAIDNAVGGLTIPEELDDLSDVTITSPTNGEILVYNNGVFENQANPASTANFADAYDPTATYNTGDVCIYNNVLYICTAPTTGTFDPSKWTATTIDNVIGSLSTLTTTDKSSIVGAVNEVVTGLDTDITFTLKSGAKFTVGSFVGKKAGIVNILNLKLTPTEATTIGTEIEVGNFANIFTYGSGTYYTGVIVDDQTKLVGSYLMTLGNQKLYLRFTDSTTRAIALTLVVFSA